MEQYLDYIMEQLEKLMAIDSPSGFTDKAADYLIEEYARLGYSAKRTVKGGVIAEIAGEGDPILVMAHVDTLGAVVSEIKGNGRLSLSPVGGFNANNVEAHNCRIYTYDGRIYDGTIQLANASLHVNAEYSSAQRSFKSVEVVLDEPVSSKEDVKALGITNGCFVCADPNYTVTSSGYIKSRFLDDKLSAAILLGYAKYIRDNNITPSRKVYQHMTVFEEVGHGACASVPSDVVELLSVDMGCVGDGLECTEHQVSICAKDGRGPYNYQVTQNLVKSAKETGVDYAVDVYPFYGSDADAALGAGIDARHGLIGAGVYASHGYERTHKDGVMNTFCLLCSYINNKSPKA